MQQNSDYIIDKNKAPKAQSLPELQEINPLRRFSPIDQTFQQQPEQYENIKFLHKKDSELSVSSNDISNIISPHKQNLQISNQSPEYSELLSLLKEQIKHTNILLQQQATQQQVCSQQDYTSQSPPQQVQPEIQHILKTQLKNLQNHKQTESIPQQANIHSMDQTSPKQNISNKIESLDIGAQEKIPLPQYEINPFEGKLHLCEFLQWLLRQKYLLQVANAPMVQKKILLNSKLPAQVSNITITQAYDQNISLDQYIDFLGKTFGPKKDNLTTQLMNISLQKYENYLVFMQRIQELCQFAGINEQSQMFILTLKLPKHVTSGTQDCISFKDYQRIVKQNMSQGWFETVDYSYRGTLLFDEKGSSKKGYKGKNIKFGDSKQEYDQAQKQTSEESIDIKAGVARVVVENTQDFSKGIFQNTNQHYSNLPSQSSLLTFAGIPEHQHNTRYKKRQHVDFQNEQPLNNISQDFTNKNIDNTQKLGTSSQHFQQQAQIQDKNLSEYVQPLSTANTSNQTQNDTLQHLLEKLQKQQEHIQQNQNLNSQNHTQIQGQKAKGRGKVQQEAPQAQVQTTSQKTNYYVLDPTRYINTDTGQINLSKAFNEVCLPTPLNYVIQSAGYHLVPKSDQSIQQNQVYANSFQNPQSQLSTQAFPITDLQNNISSKFQNPTPQQSISQAQNTFSFQTPKQNSLYTTLYDQFKNLYNQDAQQSELLANSEQRIQNFFQNEIQILNNQLQNTNFNKVITQENTQFQNYISDEQHPKIAIQLNNVRVEGIIDTGAEQTLISLEVIKKAGLENLIEKQPKDQGVYVTGINGYSRMYGAIPRLELNIQGHEIIWKNIFVQEQPNFELLIGLDMLRIFSFNIELNPTRVSFIPTLDDPRIYLDLLQNSNSQGTKIAFQKITYSNKNQKVQINQLSEIFQNINSLYPNFPIYKTYQLLLVDPPWQFNKTMYGNGPPYPCLKLNQLMKLPIQQIMDQNGSILLMWTTCTHLVNALQLFKNWGIEYKGIFLVWKKLNLSGATRIGMGYYSRVAYEFLLLGTIGKVLNLRRIQSKSTTISQELNINSSIELGYKLSNYYSGKPLQTYEQIRKVFYTEQTRNLEIFATNRNQFNIEYDLYGNQLEPKFQKQIGFESIKQNNQIISNYEQRTAFYTNVNNLDFSRKIQIQCFSQFSEQIINYTKNINVGQISTDTRIKLEQLLLKYQCVFKFDNHFSVTNLGEVDVVLKPHAKPVRMKPYKLVGEAYQFLKLKFEELLKNKLISIGSSDWGTAVMCVPKDSPTEKFRAVQNFKRVNQQIIKDKYPLRIIDHLLLNVRNKKYLCVVDMRGGFNQIRRSQNSKHIMAMILPFGQYIPEVMFFGETNAPSVFQRYVDLAIGDLYGHGIECYIDDIVVSGNTEIEVLQKLEQLFIRLQKTNFKLHPDKCQFFVNSANILGHKVEGTKIQPKQKKLTKLVKQDIPKSKKQLQQFMGSINYYRKFIPNLSILFKPFQDLLPENTKFEWNEKAQISYDIIQTFLKNQMQLLLPDLNKTFKVLLSISNFSYSCALVQEDQGGDYVVAFQSHICNVAQCKLNSYLREIDCLVWALNEFRPYLQHQHFVVQSDYKALKYLFESKAHNLQILNYQLALQDLTFEIEQINGSRLKNLLLLTFLHEDSEMLQKIENQMQLLSNLPAYDNKQNLKQKNVGSPFKNYQIILQFDGASQTAKFKQQVGAGAFIIYDTNKNILHKQSLIFHGSQTNNCAKYQALIAGLEFLKSKGWQKQKILIQGDSQLVIRQLTYVYMCNSENLQTLCMQARTLIKQFTNSKIEHIDRVYNSQCDKMAKEKLKEALHAITINYVKYHFKNYSANLDYDIDIIKCQICNYEDPEETMILCDHCNCGFHSDCLGLQDVPTTNWYCETCTSNIQADIDNEFSIDPIEDWPLIQYLQGQLDIKTMSQKTQERVLSREKIYKFENNILYKISQGSIPREVPTIGEREILIEQIHQLVGHLEINRTSSLIRTTYYWPLMQKQIEDTLRRCQLCQAHNPHYLGMPSVFPIKKGIIPLQCWYLDCIYLPKTPRNFTMVVIAICGTSKWVEGRPLVTNNSTETRDFIWDEIICRFGCPSVIVTDRGSEFKGNFKQLLKQLGIIHYYISPEYPQSNGQVERMNRTIKDGLTKLCNTMPSQNYNWDQLLQQVLFGIRITISRATKFSPFQILFCQDPIIPGYQGANNNFQMRFQTEQEQEQFILEKFKFRQQLGPRLQENLQSMEQEIENVISKRETISPSNLQLGDIVFVKRKEFTYPETRSEGPYIFLGYNNQDRSTATLIHLRTSKMRTVNITKINPIKLY